MCICASILTKIYFTRLPKILMTLKILKIKKCIKMFKHKHSISILYPFLLINMINSPDTISIINLNFNICFKKIFIFIIYNYVIYFKNTFFTIQTKL